MNKRTAWMFLLTALMIITVLILPIAASIYFSSQISLHDRKGQAEGAVNTAYYIIQHEQAQVSKGEKLESEAQKDAINLISLIRFGDDNYVWVVDSKSVMLIHPDEKLVGKTILNFTDVTGTKVFQLMTDTVRDVGFGYMQYWWPKPGHMDGISYEKVSYIRQSPHWNWIIGAGVYRDDILLTMWQSKFRYFILMNISICLIVVCLFLHSKLVIAAIANQIPLVKETVCDTNSTRVPE